MSGDVTLILIAKEPRIGQVKTRLIPPCSPAQAAMLAEAALADTLAVLAKTPAHRRVLALDGAAGSWVPDSFDVVKQVSGGLDERIAGTFDAVTGPMLIVGMDTPQLTPALLDCDFASHPAWLGPAADGGFWALGLAEPDPDLVRGVPMSTPRTYVAQREQLERAGLTVGDLAPLRDVDTWTDALAVAQVVPDSAFGQAVRNVRAELS